MDVSKYSCAIPAVKSARGWAYSPKDKANLLADLFASKFKIPRREVNERSVEWPQRISHGFAVVRSRAVARSLEALEVDSGKVPDGLATRVLKTCARQLCFPLAKLIRRILAQGFWPTSWIIHWLMPCSNASLCQTRKTTAP